VVTETWPPEVNGVAITLSKLVRHLRNRQHSVQLIRPRQNKKDTGADLADWSEMLLGGFPIPKYPQLRLGLPNKKALIKAWSNRRPDLVHIATEGPLGWSALQAALFLKLPVTSDFRTNFHSYCQHYGVKWLSKPIVAYLRKFHNRTTYTMVPTVEMRNQLEILGLKNLTVVARGIDTTLFHPNKRKLEVRQSWNVRPDTIVLLSVGRLAAEKNLDLTIETYQFLKENGRNVRLIIAGDGPLRQLTQIKCPDAIFTGMCTHEQLALLYANSDLLLFPSLTETFGNVTLESLASETPVLAFKSAAAGELIEHGVNGWLSPIEDKTNFKEQALKITENSLNLIQARLHARKSVEHFGWDEIAAKVEAIFKTAIYMN
jgi:glycosyltransferase involved in cell wall biosynthesis